MADIITADYYASVQPGAADPALTDRIEAAIGVASAWIRAECGREFADLAATATARVYAPRSLTSTLFVNDFGSLSGLVVVDSGTTLTIDSDFAALPSEGRDATGVVSCWYVLERFYAPWSISPGSTVSVTAKWGMAATSPALVLARQACVEIVSDLLKLPSSNYGVIGLTDGLAVRVRQNTHVAELLATYVRADRGRRWAVA